jgi:lysyl endopeptidase
MCTGTLLADGDAGTQTPWFYSANHCFDNESAPYKSPAQMQQVANTLSTLWDFQASSCNSGTPSSSWRQVSGGATYLYNNPESDVLFLRLNGGAPAGPFFSGWDANALAAGTPVLTLHHPEGDLKKVSQGSVTGYVVPGVAGGPRTFIEVLWNSGTTEPGSSGAGLWTQSGGQYYLRGGLWGGTALCTNPSGRDDFSRFDQVYPQLSAYLGAAIAPAFDYSDLWWNPNESGWGLNLVQHPSKVVFGVWYTYEMDGTRTWYVMPTGSWTSSTTYTGPLYVTNGPSFEKAFDPAQVQTREVGTLTLNFSSQNAGTFSYSVDGVTGTKSMQRQTF